MLKGRIFNIGENGTVSYYLQLCKIVAFNSSIAILHSSGPLLDRLAVYLDN